MKTAVIDNNNIVLKSAEDIKLDGKKGAVVKVSGCGLCGSDIVKFVHKIAKDGTVLGHEIVAEIVDINSETEFKKGDVIVTSHHIPCGKCVYCRHGNVSMCRHFKETNIIPGGFSEYVYLSEEHLQNVAHLKPENLTNIEASFYEPLGCIVRAVKRANLLDGDNVLVVGLGSIGILASQTLKAYGYNVTGCDLIAERIEFLKSFGIEAFDVRKLIDDYKADCIFMTSGADKAIDTALKYVRNGGKILDIHSSACLRPVPASDRCAGGRSDYWQGHSAYYRPLPSGSGSFWHNLRKSARLLSGGNHFCPDGKAAGPVHFPALKAAGSKQTG